MTYNVSQETIEHESVASTHENTPFPSFRQPGLHTRGESFCFDALCSCHAVNWLAHLWEPYMDGLLTPLEADQLLMGRLCP
jgi:hypothetical protein